jgi:4-hydroxy-tetrahydrodipicolinate synthase
MSGDDDLTLTMMTDPEIRATGVISVMSNIVPGPLAKMVEAQRQGKTSEAKALGEQLDPLFKLVGCKVKGERKLDGRIVEVEDKYRNPVPVKTMLAALGFPVGLCRRPLGKMAKAGVDRCREALVIVHKSAPELLRPIEEAFRVNLSERLQNDSVWAELTRK